MRAVLVLLVLALIAPTASAQPTPGPGAAQRRERIKKRVLAVRASTLIDELSLDEPTSAKLFPVLGKYDGEFEKLLVSRAEIMRRLQSAASLDPKAIEKVIDEAVANQRGFWDVEDKRLAELRKILTPVQIARLLIVLPALERQIQNQLRKAVQGAGKNLGPNPFATKHPRQDPFDDDDSDRAGNVEPADDGLRPPGRTQPVRPQGKPPQSGSNCDPFSNLHGCH